MKGKKWKSQCRLSGFSQKAILELQVSNSCFNETTHSCVCQRRHLHDKSQKTVASTASPRSSSSPPECSQMKRSTVDSAGEACWIPEVVGACRTVVGIPPKPSKGTDLIPRLCAAVYPKMTRPHRRWIPSVQLVLSAFLLSCALEPDSVFELVRKIASLAKEFDADLSCA